jgi:hypothetical protein
MSKMVFVMQGQTTQEKNAEEAFWQDAKNENMVEVVSKLEPNQTWMTTINTNESDTTKIREESEYEGELPWVSKVFIESLTLVKEVVNPQKYTFIQKIY